jgi:beta-glucanase (GH16 family)
VCGCSNGSATSNTIPPSPVQVAAPAISTKPTQAGAQIVFLTTSTAGATIRYTLDGSTPTTTSTVYLAPLLIATNVTLNAYATLAGDQDSAVTNRAFALKIASGTLVWSDEFTNPTGSIQQPDPAIWDYNTGNHGGYGNHELETYCAWASTAIPCDPTQPNVYVGTDGFLHIVARQPSKGVYTSARLKTQGRFSFQYGRLEARIRAPEAQGMWPAFWTLGNNVATVEWPACGEQDIMERVNGALNPDWNEGSIHGVGFTGDVGLGTKYFFPKGQTAAGWHTYGMIWKKGSVAYYVDDPAKPYVTYTNPESIAKFKDGIWPFDPGDSAFLILNLAVGGDWPKDPDATTPFPASLLVDYVRLYAN